MKITLYAHINPGEFSFDDMKKLTQHISSSTFELIQKKCTLITVSMGLNKLERQSKNLT